MRIAIVGAGIAGLGSAWLLRKQGHAVTLFEANDYLGGHTHTVDITLDGVTAPVDTGIPRFQRSHVPASRRAVRRARRRQRSLRDVFLGAHRRGRARMGGDERRVPFRAAVERAAAGLLADARRRRALQSGDHCAARTRRVVVDLARRISRRATLRRAAARLVPAADGGGDLVVAEEGHPRLSAADVRPLLPQPRAARHPQPAAVADSARRRPGVRREDCGAAARRAPRDARAVDPARHAWRRRRGRRTRGAIRRGRPRLPQRPGAPAAGRSDVRAKITCCPRSGTSRIASCCTPMSRCSRARAARGRPGTISPHRIRMDRVPSR